MCCIWNSIERVGMCVHTPVLAHQSLLAVMHVYLWAVEDVKPTLKAAQQDNLKRGTRLNEVQGFSFTHIHTYIRHKHMHTHTHIFTRTYTQTNTNICDCIQTRMHARSHTHTHIHTYLLVECNMCKGLRFIGTHRVCRGYTQVGKMFKAKKWEETCWVRQC